MKLDKLSKKQQLADICSILHVSYNKDLEGTHYPSIMDDTNVEI